MMTSGVGMTIQYDVANRLPPALSCSVVSEVEAINQMDLLGRELLFITGDPLVTNNKRDCVKALNLDTQ